MKICRYFLFTHGVIWCKMKISASSFPQFKHPLATKQRNIGLFSILLIGGTALACTSYFKIWYEMTRQAYTVGLIGWLCSIVTGIIIFNNAYDVEGAYDAGKDLSDIEDIYQRGRIYGNCLMFLSLVIVLVVMFYYLPTY